MSNSNLRHFDRAVHRATWKRFASSAVSSGVFRLTLALCLVTAFTFVLFRNAAAYDPLAPVFSVVTNDGETIEILDYIIVDVFDPNVFRIDASVGGTQVGEMEVLSGELSSLLVDSTPISNGSAFFEIRAFNLSGDVLAVETVELDIEHPTLDAEVIENLDGSRDIELTFKGLADDQIYLIYMTPDTDPTYSTEYDVLAPGDTGSGLIAAAGIFPLDYQAETLTTLVSLNPVTSPTNMNVLLLTFQGEWRSSNSVSVTVTPFPPVSTPVSPKL